MPKTLLAVDDSATMRKVLEITFAGEDFRVVGVDGSAGALAKMNDEPLAVVIDTSLGGEDGYALAKEVRARSHRAAVVLMASRYSPYDALRGRDAGVDDNIDKPFDTQALIDKVKRAIAARENAPRPVAPAPAPPSPAPVPQAAAPAPHMTAAFGGAPRGPAPAAPPVVNAPAAAAKGFPAQRTHTLSFEGMQQGSAAPAVTMPNALSRTAPSGVTPPQPPAPPPAPAPAAAFVPTSVPTAAHGAPTAAPAAPTAVPPRAHEPHESKSATATALNGQLAGKLDDLGLTPQQVEAVLALSRELVERVVWEVVPQLAETLIREEITRLTRDS